MNKELTNKYYDYRKKVNNPSSYTAWLESIIIANINKIDDILKSETIEIEDWIRDMLENLITDLKGK